MSLGQAGRQAVNPITGESRFQQPDYRRSQESRIDNPQIRTADSKRMQNTQIEPQNQDYLMLDRVSQLQEQVQMLERQLTQEVKRNSKMLVELEREVKTRTQLGDPNQIFDDLNNKLYQLETKLIASERSKSELGSKLAIQEQNLSQLTYFLKNSQNKDTNEVLQMRGMLQEKITEESSQLQKEREKTRALFMEMVRLGEQSEKLQESLSSMNQQFEQRVMSLETKIYNGEKALVQVAQRGDSGMNFINETNERIEKRVMSLEANLLGLGKDQLKDHDQLNKVDTSTQRIQEEFKSAFSLIQQDFTQRLDTRVTELINRITMEHEQRVKIMEETKQSWQLKDQINMERLQYEREEATQKIISLEQFQRIDSQKKDEAIKSLQAIIETQVNQILTNIQNEEAQRYSQEVQLRSDLLKIQENIKQENELFKAHQANITEKITDMIRIEVQTRLSTDTELKNLTSAIATDIVSDLNSLKDQIEVSNKALISQLKSLEKDQAEKAERLSIYIDEEISKVIKTTSQKYEKVKIIFQKFGESFKQHIIGYEGLKQDLNSRQTIIEQNIDLIRQDFQIALEDQQSHLLERISEEKNQILEAVNATMQILEDKVNKMDEDSANKFKILKEAVEENHDIMVEKIKLILEQNESYQNGTKSTLQLIVEAVQELKEQVMIKEEENLKSIREINESILQLKGEIELLQTNNQQVTEIQQQHKENMDKQQDDIEILQKDNDDVKLKQEDIDSLINQVKGEQQKIINKQQLLDSAIETIGVSQQQSIQKMETILLNFNQQEEEIKLLEQKLLKIDTNIEDTNGKLENEIKRIEEIIDENQKQQNIIKDQLKNIDDEEKKKQLEIQELQQSIKHLQERTKQLAPIPS